MSVQTTEQNEQIVYVEVNPSSHINGYLCLNPNNRNFQIRAFSLEKYRKEPLETIPGTLQSIRIGSQVFLSNRNPIFRITVGNNLEIKDYICINQKQYTIEHFLNLEGYQAKESGLYAGKYQPYQNYFTNLSEMQVAFLVEQAITKIELLEKNQCLGSNLSSHQELNEWQYALDYCLAHLSRFGVEQHFNFSKKKMEQTPTFQSWYQVWHRFFEIHSQEKISGLYPGVFQSYEKDIIKATEAQMFLWVKQAILRVEYLNQHLISFNDHLSLKQYNLISCQKEEWQYGLDYLLARLPRYGVDMNFDQEQGKMMKTTTFQAWYDWWDDYFIELNENPNTCQSLANHRKTCSNLSLFHPTGNFEDYLQEKIQIPTIVKKIERKVS